MPKPKNKPRPLPERDDNDHELRRLTLFLEEDVGFRLGLATYDTPATRRTYLDRLAEAVAARPVHLTTLDLTGTPQETQLLRRLQEHLCDHPAPEGKRPAVMVVGLEATIDYGKLGPELFGQPRPGRLEALASIFNANVQRDAFPRLVPAAVVLWLSPTATTIFAQAAPDLWHWRSATFGFTGPADGRLQLERMLVATPLLESENLSSDRAHDRLAMLRDLLVEMEHAADRGTPGAKARRSNLELAIGLQLHSLGDAESAIPHYLESLRLCREIGDRRGEGVALGNLGNAHARLGRVEEAIDCYQQNREIAREVGDRRGEGAALGNLGLIYADLGRVEEAIDCYQQNREIAREVGDRRGEGITLGNLGIAYYQLGRVEEAVGYHQRALEIAREIGDRRGEAADLGNLGSDYYQLGRVGEAVGYHQRALDIAREIGDRRGEAADLGNLGGAYAALGRIEEAIDLLEQSSQIGREIKDPGIIRFASEQLERLRGAEAD